VYSTGHCETTFRLWCRILLRNGKNIYTAVCIDTCVPRCIMIRVTEIKFRPCEVLHQLGVISVIHEAPRLLVSPQANMKSLRDHKCVTGYFKRRNSITTIPVVSGCISLLCRLSIDNVQCLPGCKPVTHVKSSTDQFRGTPWTYSHQRVGRSQSPNKPFGPIKRKELQLSCWAKECNIDLKHVKTLGFCNRWYRTIAYPLSGWFAIWVI
jgi:hypothetical protein